MEVLSATNEKAVVSLDRGEALAIRNVSEHAGLLPLEVRGPHEIFGRLAFQFGQLTDGMTGVLPTTGRPTTERPQGVSTRDEFGDFVYRVLQDFDTSGRSEWENDTLERFLDGLGAFALARANGRPAEEQEAPTWSLFAELIAAATGYE